MGEGYLGKVGREGKEGTTADGDGGWGGVRVGRKSKAGGIRTLLPSGWSGWSPHGRFTRKLCNSGQWQGSDRSRVDPVQSAAARTTQSHDS